MVSVGCNAHLMEKVPAHKKGCPLMGMHGSESSDKVKWRCRWVQCPLYTEGSRPQKRCLHAGMHGSDKVKWRFMFNVSLVMLSISLSLSPHKCMIGSRDRSNVILIWKVSCSHVIGCSLVWVCMVPTMQTVMSLCNIIVAVMLYIAIYRPLSIYTFTIWLDAHAS